MATTILECARCGNTFENYNPKARRKYCPDCSSIAQSEAKARWYRERHPLYRVDYKYIAPSKRQIMPSAQEINRAANSHEMSYGKYVLKYGV